MVPDPSSFSRRQVLAGLGGGAGVLGSGTLVVGATRPTALPNRVADWATNRYPTPPPASSHWQPTVTEEHAREAVALLAETEGAAKDRLEDVDSDPRPRDSGGWLETAEGSLEDGDYRKALSDATYGIQFAGEALGYARAELDEADPDELADRSRELFERIDTVVGDLGSYPVREPARDLAWYVEIESELQRGRRLADWRGLDAVRDGDDGTESEFSASDPSDVGEVTGKLLQAEIAVGNAERYRDQLWKHVGDADETYGAHLRRVVDDFRDELESMPTRDEVRSAYIDDDTERYGPYEFAHSRLATWCFPASISPPWTTPIDDEFLVLRTLAAARGLGDWRAHEDAVDDLVVDPDDEGFDPGHVLAEKRRARSTYRNVIGSDPTPFMVVLSERAIEDVRVADIDRGSWQRDDSKWTAWNERVQAYLYARIGRARLRAYPDVYELVVDE